MSKITIKEFWLAIVFSVMGFVISSREVIMFMNGLNPIAGLVLFYGILYGSLYILSYAGLIIYKFKIDNPIKILGLLLITFAFFIIVNWESAYIQFVTMGNMGGASPMFLQSEDGAVWYFWYDIMNVNNIEIARLLTYVLTPFLLVLIGSLMVSRIEMKR